MTGADFFALCATMFLARAMSRRQAMWACWAFLGLALLKKWLT